MAEYSSCDCNLIGPIGSLKHSLFRMLLSHGLRRFSFKPQTAAAKPHNLCKTPSLPPQGPNSLDVR